MSERHAPVQVMPTERAIPAAVESVLRSPGRPLEPTLREATTSFADLNESLPPLRALAIASEPGIEELPDTIAAFVGPALGITDGRSLNDVLATQPGIRLDRRIAARAGTPASRSTVSFRVPAPTGPFQVAATGVPR